MRVRKGERERKKVETLDDSHAHTHRETNVRQMLWEKEKVRGKKETKNDCFKETGDPTPEGMCTGVHRFLPLDHVTPNDTFVSPISLLLSWLSFFVLLVGGPLLHLAQVTRSLHTTCILFSSWRVRVDERTGTLKASSIKDALSVRIIKTNLFALSPSLSLRLSPFFCLYASLFVVVFHFLLSRVNTWLYDHHWSSHSLTVHNYCKCC